MSLPRGSARPPVDPRNCWRVVDALGVSREVGSARNAFGKAAAFDRVCPARELPHRVEHWTGSEWVDARETRWRVPMEDLRLVEAIGPCVCNPNGEPHFTHCPHVNHQRSAEVRVYR